MTVAAGLAAAIHHSCDGRREEGRAGSGGRTTGNVHRRHPAQVRCGRRLCLRWPGRSVQRQRSVTWLLRCLSSRSLCSSMTRTMMTQKNASSLPSRCSGRKRRRRRREREQEREKANDRLSAVFVRAGHAPVSDNVGKWSRQCKKIDFVSGAGRCLGREKEEIPRFPRAVP